MRCGGVRPESLARRLIGGIDHVFLADRRDYFLGLQLRFTDEDMKTVLPFAGGASAAH